MFTWENEWHADSHLGRKKKGKVVLFWLLFTWVLARKLDFLGLGSQPATPGPLWRPRAAKVDYTWQRSTSGLILARSPLGQPCREGLWGPSHTDRRPERTIRSIIQSGTVWNQGPPSCLYRSISTKSLILQIKKYYGKGSVGSFMYKSHVCGIFFKHICIFVYMCMHVVHFNF